MARVDSGSLGSLKISRRWLSAVAAGLAIAGPAGRLATAAQEATPSGTPGPVAFTFTDDRGITVSLPERPRRVVAFSPVAGALWDLGVRPVGVFGPFTGPDGTPDPQVGNLDVTAVTWLGDWDGFDFEQLVALQPDLVVGLSLPDVPNTLWYIPEEIFPQLSSRVPTIGLSLAQGGSVLTLFDRVEELAVQLGTDLTDPAQVAARETFEAATADLAAAIAEAPGLSVLVVSADAESLYVANPSWFGDLPFFTDQGLAIIVPETEERWQLLSWEQASRYQPDLYLVDARSGELPPVLADIPTWQAQPAVLAGQVAPWAAVYPYSRRSFTGIVEALAATVRASDPAVVDEPPA